MIKIGLTDFTPENKLINIRDKNQVIKAKYAIGKDDILKYSLMNEHYIEISFELNRDVLFKRSDYIEWEGDKYTLRSDYQPKQVNKRKYQYTLKFEALEMFFQDMQYWYMGQGLKESELRMTGNPQYFLKYAVENANRYFKTTEFNIGSVEPTEIKDIIFDVNTNTFDALTQIADEYSAEWYITGKTIHLLNKVSFGDEVDFETEVSVLSMDREEGESTTRYTRILALGSTRNIPNDYRATTSGEAVDAIYPKRLRIPISKGDVIDAYPNMSPDEVVEGTVIFDEVYPKRVGTIEAIGTIEYTDTNEETGEVTKWNAYKIKDSGINFKKEYVLPGIELKLSLQSGDLNGRDFALIFHEKGFSSTDDSQYFEIVRTDEYGKLLPNDIMKPKVGDKYVLYGFNIALVSDQYVPAGEQELYDVASTWQQKQLRDTGVYECPTVIQYFKDHQMDLAIGQKVKLIKDIGSNRNIIKGSKKIDVKAIKGSGANLIISVDLINGETYTLSYESTDLIISDGYPKFYIWEYFNWSKLQNLGDISAKSRTFKCTLPTGRYTFTVYNHDYPQGGTISKLKLEKGNKATDWSEAPEDTEGAIRSSRIMGFEKSLNNKFDATYIVGDNSTYSRFNKIENDIKELQHAGVVYENTGGGSGVYVIKQFDSTRPTDFNVYSAAASDAKYFNKQTGGSVLGETIFQKNIQVMGTAVSDVFQNSTFTAGQFGSGFQIKKDSNGQSYMEIDNLLVRREAVFNRLTIAEIKSVGGTILLSLANMIISKVEVKAATWKCYFDNEDGAIPNDFAIGDQAICRKFTGKNIKYYWVLVTAVGTNYIEFSKTDKDGSGVPDIDDEVVQLGNRTDINRQYAIMLSAYGSDAPSIKQYAGINSYDMTGKEVTAISPKGNKFTGSFTISTNGTTSPIYKDLGVFVNGRTYYLNDRVSHLGSYWVCIVNSTIQIPNEDSTVWRKDTAGQSDINNAINNIQIGGANLVDGSKEITVNAVSGQGANLNISTDMVNGETYTLSYESTDLVVANDYPQFYIWKLGDWTSLQGLGTITAKTRTFVWNKPTGKYLLTVYNHNYPQSGTINKLKLEKGNKATDWTLSDADVQKEINAAQTAADNAKAAADKAQTDANSANKLLADIADDDLLTPDEKQDILKEWQIIQGEYPTITAQAATYGVSSSDYTSKYNALSTYITPLLSNMTINSAIVGTTFRATFKAYYDAKIALLKTVTDKAKTLADNAQTTANAAQTAADNAKAAADKAQTDANSANKLLADIADDNLLTVSEKQDTLKEWQIIQGDYPTITAQAATYGVSSSDYTIKYNSLNNYITPLLANMGVDSVIVGATFRLSFKNYYDAKITLLKAITDKAKALADNAQTTANAAQTAAANAKAAADKAQTDANNAQSSANTANSLLADIANDNKFDPSEKQSIKKEWDAIVSEYTKNITQASIFGVSSTIYTNAYNALNTYITPLLSNLNVTSDIVGTTFRATFKSYYDARLDLLNAIAKKAKDLADAAQNTANQAQTGVTEVKASLVVLNDKIESKVSQTDFNSLQGRVSTAESTITQQAGQIALTVEKVDKKNAAYKSYTNVSTDRPSVPYSKGDLWITYEGRILQSANTRLSGSFIESDWKETVPSANDIVIGTRNLLRDSLEVSVANQTSSAANRVITADLINGETYTLSYESTDLVVANNYPQFYIWKNPGIWNEYYKTLGNISAKTRTFVWDRPTDKYTFTVYNHDYPQGGTINKLKLEKGNKATDWSEAPEDTQARITQAQTAANNAQGTADSKNRTFYSDTQPATPSGGFKPGDIWYKINTIDGCYETYRWNGSSWGIINVSVSKAKQVITDNSITNLVEKTGINGLGVGETLYSKINQTADEISLAIGKIKIGSDNLLNDSYLVTVNAVSGQGANLSFSEDMVNGETYTLSYESTDLVVANDYPQFYIWKLNDWTSLQGLGTITAKTRTFVWNKPTGRYTFTVYNHNYPQSGAIKKLKLERGNMATAWTASNDEVTAELKLNNNGISLKGKTIWLTGTTIAKSIEAEDLKVGSRTGSSALEVLKDGTFYAKGSSGTNQSLVIDSGTQSIEIVSPYSASGDPSGGNPGSTTKKSTVSISSQSGGVRVSNDNNDTSIVSTNGIFANNAGQSMYPLSSADYSKAAIVGLGNGNVAPGISGNSFVAGVYGRASNNGSGEAYGGYFDMLKANGMYVAVKQISITTTLTKYDCYVSCYNSTDISLYLPSNPYIGMVIILRRVNPGNIHIYGNGKKIHTDGSELSDVWAKDGRGDSVILIFDGSFWMFNYWMR